MKGLSAAVYTQTTDCEVEVNGLMTYDRAVIKLPVEAIAQAQKTLYEPLPTIRLLVPTAETAPQTWRYTIQAPEAGWPAPDFNDSSWSRGESGFGTSATPGAGCTRNGSPVTSGSAGRSSSIRVRCMLRNS